MNTKPITRSLVGEGLQLQSGEIEQKIKHAQELISSGELDAAANLCTDILRNGYESAEVLYLLAQVTNHYGNDTEVVRLLRRAYTLQPEDDRILFMLGSYFRTHGKDQEAADCFRRAAQFQLDSFDALLALGKTLRSKGELNEAESIYRHILNADPDHHSALKALGNLLLQKGKFLEAAQCLEQVLSRNAEDAVTMARLGAAFAELDRRDEARQLLMKAIDREPQHPDAYKTLGDLAHADGHLEEATNYYQKHFERKYNLIRFAQKFRTDKWGSHDYARHYHKYFYPLRNRSINLLEIGVGGYSHPLRGGASLRMWKAFFPNANIFGADLHDKSALEEERIKIFQGDQGDPEFLRGMAAKMGRIDILIDDGSHINSHVIDTFKTLFPLIADDGIYVVEDTQTSYWPKFGGSSTELNHPDSMLTFFKSLTDGLNYEELLIPGYDPGYFAKHIIAIHFYHNLVFIFKGENKEGSNYVKDGVLHW